MDSFAPLHVVAEVLLVLHVRFLVFLGGVVFFLFGCYRCFGVCGGVALEFRYLVTHSGKAFHYRLVIVVLLVAQGHGGILLHELHGFLGKVRSVHFGKAGTVGAVSATALAEQHHIVGIVWTRETEGLVERITFKFGRVIMFDVLCHFGGFQSSPTIIPHIFFEVLLVHLFLNILAITADFARHADCDFVLLQQPGDFGYQGDEFQTGADIVLVLTELHCQRLHIVATALYELLVGVRFLNGRNVFALQVLCYRHFLGGLVRNFHDDSRYLFQSCHEGGTVSAFSEHDFHAVVRNGAHPDRL